MGAHDDLLDIEVLGSLDNFPIDRTVSNDDPCTHLLGNVVDRYLAKAFRRLVFPLLQWIVRGALHLAANRIANVEPRRNARNHSHQE